MTEKVTFEFTQEGFFDGDYYRVGDRISLYPVQAKFETHRLRRVIVEKLAPVSAKQASKSKSSTAGE